MTTPSHKQFYRLSPAASALYVGPEGEVIVQLSDFLLRVQDGVTPGGFVTVSKNYVDTQIVTIHATIDAEIAALSVPQYAADTGATNAYVCTLSPALIAHTVGKIIAFKIASGHTNSGASTFNPGPGVKALQYTSAAGSVALLAGMVKGDEICFAVYDGTQYELINPVLTPSGTTNKFASVSAAALNIGHFLTVVNGSGDIGDAGYVISGNTTNVLTIAGILTGTKILALDGNGNAFGSYTATGNTSVLVTFTGAATSNEIVDLDGAGNLRRSGFLTSSFDLAGAAATALSSANAHSDALALWTWSGASTLATGPITFTHNLGFNPLKAGVRIAIVCTSADAGYSIGDVVHLCSSGPANASNNILTVFSDASGNATSVRIGVGVSIANKGTNALTNLVLANWNLYIGVIPNH